MLRMFFDLCTSNLRFSWNFYNTGQLFSSCLNEPEIIFCHNDQILTILEPDTGREIYNFLNFWSYFTPKILSVDVKKS